MSRKRGRRPQVSAPAKPGGYGKGGLVVAGQRDEGWWVAAGQTGAGNVQQKPLWGGTAAELSSVGGSGVVQVIMVEAPRLSQGNAAALSRSRLKLDFIDGVIDPVLQTGAINGDDVSVFVGLYIGEYVSGSNLYTNQDPSNVAEVSREWLYLEGRTVTANLADVDLGGVAATPPIFNLTGAVDIELEAGEALMLAIAWNGVAAGNILGFCPNIRLHMNEPT